ncbi:MAG: flippase-like domain-containing protein [Anaerolineaceae bacterium]|nr:flippase-like domain-containing protein [Anaerolineaceae bacterium]
MKKQYTGILIRVALSVVLLVLLFAIIDRDALFLALAKVDVTTYLIGLVVFFGAVSFWTLRWYLFIRASGDRSSYGRAYMTLLIGFFYSMFLPTIVGNDVGRMYELGRESDNKKTTVVSTVLLDRVVGLISLALMALLALLVGSDLNNQSNITLTVVGVVVALVGGWLIFFNRRFMEWVFGLLFRLPLVNRLEDTIRELYEALFLLHNQPRLLLTTGLVSLLNNITETLAVVFAAQALGVTVNPVYFFLFMPVIWIVTLIPISISGLGLREGAFAFFLGPLGVSSGDAVAISLLFYSYSVIVGVLGGVILLRGSVLEYSHKVSENSVTPG